MPEIVYVNSIWVGLPVGTVVGPGMIIGTNAFATIQEGVNAVSAQGTVQVSAGLYNEPLINVLRSMQLHGAQYGVDARTRSGNPAQESIVQGNTANGSFVLTAEGDRNRWFHEKQLGWAGHINCRVTRTLSE